MKKQNSFLAIALLFSLLAASTVSAYIPPAWFIIRNLAAKRSGVRSVRIVSQVTVYDSGKPTDHRFKIVSIFDPLSQSLHSHVFTSGGELYGFEKNGEAIPLLTRVLFDPNSREIFAALKKADILIAAPEKDTAAEGVLRRWNGTIAWVFGEMINGKATPQLWVEKDSFLPLRLLLGDEDFQFIKYRFAQALAYPRSILTLNRAGVTLFQEDLQDVKVNSALSPEEISVANGFSELGNASPEREFIQKYYDGIR